MTFACRMSSVGQGGGIGAERVCPAAGDGRTYASRELVSTLLVPINPLASLLKTPVVLGHQLTGNVEATRSRARGRRIVPANRPPPRRAPPRSSRPARDCRPWCSAARQPIRKVGGLGEVAPWCPERPPGWRVVGVAADAGDRVVPGFDDDTAADAAVTTGGLTCRFMKFLPGPSL